MKKEIVYSLIICLGCAFQAQAALNPTPVEVNGICFTVYDNSYEEDGVVINANDMGARVVPKFDNTPYDIENFIIPNTVSYQGVDYPVKSVAKGVFTDNSTVKTIKLSNNIKMVSDVELTNCGVEKIIFPEEYVILFPNDFQGCYNLSTIVFNSKETVIDCDLYDNFPENVTKIVFEGDSKLYNSSYDTAYSYASRAASDRSDNMEIEWGTGKHIVHLGGLDWFTGKNLKISGNLRSPESAWTSYMMQNLETVEIEKRVAWDDEQEYFLCFADFGGLDNLKTVICRDPEPWPLRDAPSYINVDVSKVTLYVPNKALMTYKSHPVWGKFNNILPIVNSVTDIVSDEITDGDANVEYFNLQGAKVSNPEAGSVVIRRQGGKVSKIYVK